MPTVLPRRLVVLIRCKLELVVDERPFNFYHLVLVTYVDLWLENH